jgi:aspartyl-tRNA(Asn)/glutamyl-tRNA(Gln) amidotransferase subunit A
MEITRRKFNILTGGAMAWQALPGNSFALPAEGPGGNSGRVSGGNTELASLALAEAAARLRARQVTSVELTQACLERIDIYNPKLDAFITLTRQQALAEARQADAEINAGKYRGPLHGIPLAVKDNIDTAGVRTTGGSALFEDRVPAEDAPVISRLKAAGAVLVGKTNLMEFAIGASNSSYWGPVRNPWNLLHYSGGSSSGSGAAVTADLCYGALGTDDGGSVRIPAAYCGIVGFKATYGLIPIRGIIPGVSSLNHCGPLTRTVEDAAIMLNSMTGYDRLDITSVEHPKEDYVAGMRQPVKDLRLGMPVGHFDRLQPDVQKVVMEAIDLLGTMTKGAKNMTLPPLGLAANLDSELLAWHEPYFKTHPDKYMAAVRRSLASATAANVSAVDYIHALWALQELRRTVDDSFTDVDLVVLATTRVVAPTIEELLRREVNTKPQDPELDFPDCVFFDVYGLPAISVPCGFSSTGLPIGLTIAGPHFSESRVLALANAYEKATDWHERTPPLTPETPVPPIPPIPV